MGKTLLVTGASRGIGRAIVDRFFKTRDDVSSFILVARPSHDFAQLVGKLSAEDPTKTIHRYDVDLADSDQVTRFAQDVAGEVGNIDILISNAGLAIPAKLADIDLADFQRSLSVNLLAPFLLVQKLMGLGNTFELIVNVASTAGERGRPGWMSYSASKAALINMSDVMRQEMAAYGTRVVCVLPGRCATELRRKLAPDEDQSRIMQPEEMAEVVELLTSRVGRLIDDRGIVVRSPQ